MNNKEKVRKIDGLVRAANELRIKGEKDKAISLLDEAEKTKKGLRNKEKRKVMGDIAHYKARTLQAMKKYSEALFEIEKAIHLRRKDPIQRAYSMFQRYICKDYAGIKILPREARESQEALLKAIIVSDSCMETGDFFQNLAYVESQEGKVSKAILFYEATLTFRKAANDERGKAMTWARLAECYERIGDKSKAGEYGELALDYFKAVGDLERIKQVQSVLEKL